MRNFYTTYAGRFGLRAILVSALVVPACAGDTGTIINVAPSAEHKLAEILEAVAHLNEQIGTQTFVVQTVDSEERVDGQVIVRCTPGLGKNSQHETRIGNTRKTREGVVVSIAENATACAIAHEFGHAAGLEHVNDSANLMYRYTAADRWRLNDVQLDHLRELL